jgi:hypothetical protein
MLKGRSWTQPVGLILLAVGFAVGTTVCSAADDLPAPSQASAPTDAGLYLKVLLSSPVKMSRLKPGDLVEGSLSRDVYSGDSKFFSERSRVRLTVDHLEKRRRAANDHWPWVVKVFTPRHENFPVFKSATVEQPEGESSLQVSLISLSRMREVQATAKKDKPRQPRNEPGGVEVRAHKAATFTMVLEASAIVSPPLGSASKDETVGSKPNWSSSEVLPAGTRCKLLLLADVSASKSKAGDPVRARLLEPVLLNSKVILPAGSLFEGKVVKQTPPRWLSRAGSLYLTFTSLTVAEGDRVPIVASLAGAELDQRSHTRMDAEGRLRGERPGKTWMAINLGVSAGIAKEVDDGVQLIVEAIVSTATDASTAGTSRIIASCVSGLYMVTRHGRDVVLPRFTEMDISLDRPASMNPASSFEPSTTAAGGK